MVFADLDGITCLDGARGQRDIIDFHEDKEFDMCISEGHIGFRLQQGEFSTRWKAVVRIYRFVKHIKSDLYVLWIIK